MNLRFYRADAGYCDFLRQTDACVPHINDDKNTRPLIVEKKAWPELALRCCDFIIDEEHYRKYCTQHGLEMPK